MISEPELQDLSKFKVEKGFRGKSSFLVVLWQITQATLFLLSPQPFYGWRRCLLRAFGAKVGKGVLIRPTARITYPWKVTFGDHCWVGDHAELYSLGSITLGEHSVISQKSYLCAAYHDVRSISFPLVQKPIVVEREAWVATDCFIAPGVTIGKGAIIGARSAVFSDIPPRTVAMGTPATVRRERALPTMC